MVRTKIRQRAVRLMREIDEPPGKAVELSVRNRRCFLLNAEILIVQSFRIEATIPSPNSRGRRFRMDPGINPLSIPRDFYDLLCDPGV